MGNKINTKGNAGNYERVLFGRRVIKTSAEAITDDNVLFVLQEAMNTHNLNTSEIEYLWQYYKGNQPILYRKKEVRPEINNKIVVNRANEIVSFKVGYLIGEPIQYIGRNGSEELTNKINTLNEWMIAQDKASKDQEVVEWQMICGTSYRLVLPTNDPYNEAPFDLYTLDPRETFVVYSNDIGNKPIMAVKYMVDDQTITHYSIYTEDHYWRVDGDIITESKPHRLGMIPIFEYPANNGRLGSFEIVLPLLDALNKIESNRMDGMEQTVQAFIKFINCDITEEDFVALRDLGAIKVKSTEGLPADVDVVSNELSQNESETFKDDIYKTILAICGVPNQNSAESGSINTTGAAVMLRNGWSLAEARAKDLENMFRRAEKRMLRLITKICEEIEGLEISPKDISLQFTRRNYENIQSKSQVLVTMLQEQKVHPLLAFQYSGMFADPERAYKMSNEYYEEQLKKWQPVAVDESEYEEDINVSESGQLPEEA